MVQIGERFLVFFHTTLTKDSLKRHQLFNFPNAVHASSGAIPGLFIFPDLISVEEEQSIVSALDKAEGEFKWQKLLNRRVQHYGFEFKYGTNDVNPDKSLGEMPEFLHFLRPKLEKVLSHFEVQHITKEDKQTPKVTFSNEPVAQNVLTQFGYFDQMTANDYMPG